MANSNNAGKLLAGLILGAAAGVAAGLLMAPESGIETRKKLKKKAEDLKGDIDKYSSEIGEKAKQLAKDVEDKLKKTKTEDTARDYDDTIGV